MTLDRDMARLRERIETLEEEKRQLSDALAPRMSFGPIGLTRKEGAVVAALIGAAGAVVTKDRLMLAIYGFRNDVPEMKIVDVFVCKARAKLRMIGAHIATHWGVGYAIDRASVAVIHRALQARRRISDPAGSRRRAGRPAANDRADDDRNQDRARLRRLRPSRWLDRRDDGPRKKQRRNHLEDAMMRLSTLLLLMMAAPALAQPIPPIEDVDASRLVVIDGDTVWLRCAAAARGCFEKIRIANIDAPELRGARCDGERALAARAGEQLRARLSGPVTIQRCERGAPPRCVDRFGRTLAYLSTQAGDVGSWMIAQGLAEPWRADRAAARARQRAWCGNNG